MNFLTTKLTCETPPAFLLHRDQNCIGRGLNQTLDTLRRHGSRLAPCRFETVEMETFVGEVAGLDNVAIRGDLHIFDCRNNRLAQLGLIQNGFVEAVSDVAVRVDPDRVGIFVSTSTAGILQTELAYRRRDPVTACFDRWRKPNSVLRRLCCII